ncbi:MAG: carboxypeptidase regulatory-like domain-containing protein [Acidobacteria bacterium]|nr:carboxypeptidase regulatory-like domain-containing protein [Acidobacteriota bacterium]
MSLLLFIFLSNTPNAAAQTTAKTANGASAAVSNDTRVNGRAAGNFAPATPATVVWSENFDGVTAPALPAGWTTVTTGRFGAPPPFATVASEADSAPNVAVTNGFDDVSTNGLVSPPITLPIQQIYFQLSFRQTYNFENLGATCWDGGILQLSTDGGTTYNNVTSAAVGATFIANGYNGRTSTLTSSSNPLPNEFAFCGTRTGYVTTVLAVPASLGGYTIKFRWLGTWDRVNFRPNPNWRIDSISLVAVPPDPLNIVVDTAVDNVSQNACTAAPRDCSLRGAIERTNATPGADTISFDPTVFATPQTTTLGNSPLVVENNGGLTINGPGANLLTLDANNQSSVMVLKSGGTLNVSGFTFTGGNAIYANALSGGGLLNEGGSLTVSNSAIVNNRATNNGGGISAGGLTTVANCTISGNTATGGGGIEVAQGGSLTLTNSTVSGNTATGSGGGIVTGGPITINSSTIADNTAGDGGGISQQDPGDISLLNTIVAGNRAATAPDFGGTILSQGYNLIGSTSGATVTGTTTGNILNQDARLLPLLPNNAATPTHALPPNSPAVNAGTAVNTPALDQRGKTRTGATDIGAYEAGANLVVTNTANSSAGSLRAAVDLANSTAADESITFNIPANDPGCAGRVCTIGLTGGQLAVANNGTLIVSNTSGTDNLRVSGNNASRVFSIGSGANLTLKGLTVTNGSVSGENGGGLRSDGTLTLLDCAVTNSTANGGSGGGIASSGTLTARYCSVSGNSVLNNPGGGGGGILNTGTMEMSYSTVSGNTVSGVISDGGGILSSGLLNLSSSTVSGNTASDASTRGGGLFVGSGTTNVTNATFSGNAAESGGGLFVINLGTLNLANSTIAANSGTYGPGMYTSGATVSRNSIFSDNTGFLPGDVFGQVVSQGYNLIGNASGIVFSGDLTGILYDQPARLAPLGFYGGPTQTHALLSNSPAIDAGNAATSPVTDQRGAARIGAADIGAFELNNAAGGGAFVAALPGGTQNAGYNYTLVPNDGGFTYSVTSGSLPNGVSLSGGSPGNSADEKQNDFAPAAAVTLTGTPTQAGTFNFTVTATNGANSNSTNYTLFILGPTAAPASVGGRVMTADGRAVGNAIVTLTDASGAARSTRTGTFGNYRFDDVRTGETYVVRVVSKRYAFVPQLVTVDDSLSDLNLTAQP